MVRPSIRTLWWPPLLGTALLGFGVLALDGDPAIEPRLVAVALAVGASFALDDAASEAVASSPTPLLLHRLVRLALVLPLLATAWLLLVSRGDAGALGTGLTLELAGMLAVTWAGASVAASRTAAGRGGIAAGPLLLLFLGVAIVALPDEWALAAAGAGDPRWDGAGLRWASIVVAASLVFVLASRGPGSARWRASRSLLLMPQKSP